MIRILYSLILLPSSAYYCQSQNVGIGINTPAAPLHIVANSEAVRLQGDLPYIAFHSLANVYKGFVWQGPDDHFSLGTAVGNPNGSVRFYNNGSLNMVVNPNGDVGIGTFTPAAKLHIESQDEALRLGGPDPYLTFYTGSNYKAFFGTAGNDIELGLPSGNSSGGLHFYTTGNNRMSILNDGLVRIRKDNEALRLSGTSQYLSFYDVSGNYKGYLWNNGNNIHLSTSVPNTTGSLNLGVQGLDQLVVQSNGQIRVGALPCTINTFHGFPKLSIHGGPLGFKKPDGNQVGEWALAYSFSGGQDNNDFNFIYNGVRIADVDDADGEWIVDSDIRLKENFEAYKSVLQGVKKLDVMTYHYKADKSGKKSFGLIAQNVQQYFPEIVTSDGPDNMLAIAYSKTGVLAIKAIQEQQQIIESLQKQVEAIKASLAGRQAEMPMQIGKQQEIIESQQKRIDELEKKLSKLENKLK